MTKEDLLALAAQRYSAEPEYPWNDENYILRHRENHKWFAVGMRISYAHLGLEGLETVDVANFKCGPLLMDVYRRQPGVLPGYHMNKDHWITVLLDGSASEELIRELLELSYDLTGVRSARQRKREEDPDLGSDGEQEE